MGASKSYFSTSDGNESIESILGEMETPLAIVVLEPGATITAEEVLKFSNDKLGKFQRLNSVILRNSLFPRNDLGKLMKRMLRDEYLAGQKL